MTQTAAIAMLLDPEGDEVQHLELAGAEFEPLAFQERVTFPAEACSDEVMAVEDLVISGVVEPTGRGFSLVGEVTGNAHLRCARCLKEFTLAFTEHVSLRLVSAAQAPRDEETQLGREDLEVRYFEEPVVDLAELAAEQVQLATPLKPLCQESCHGLCPRCGADLNQGLCACPRPTDSRWTPLLEWRKRG